MNKQNTRHNALLCCSDIILIAASSRDSQLPFCFRDLGAGSGALKYSAVELHSQSTLTLKVKRAGGVMLHMLVLCQPGISLCYGNPHLPGQGSLRSP